MRKPPRASKVAPISTQLTCFNALAGTCRNHLSLFQCMLNVCCANTAGSGTKRMSPTGAAAACQAHQSNFHPGHQSRAQTLCFPCRWTPHWFSLWFNINLYHPISICVGFLDPTIDNRLNGPLYRILRTCLRKSQLWTTVLCSRIVLRPKPTVPKCSKGRKARRRCLTKLTVPKACFEKD